jgi:ribosomal protein S27E
MDEWKAIQTFYGGRKYRSCLEARWAVFFDTAGIDFGYEEEGFQLPSGWYLPDFKLLEQKYWIEIKGQEPTELEVLRAMELAEHTGWQVFIFSGGMWCDETKNKGSQTPEADVYFPSGGGDCSFTWVVCPICKTAGLVYSNKVWRLPCLQCDECLAKGPPYMDCDHQGGKLDCRIAKKQPWKANRKDRIAEAFRAATSARLLPVRADWERVIHL